MSTALSLKNEYHDTCMRVCIYEGFYMKVCAYVNLS